MKPSFSEFSYGYAVTEDIVRSTGPLKAAPLFPSLRSEGTQGGFDVKLGLTGSPLFLQFKLSDCMVGKAAHEAQQGLFMVPFYRMHIPAGGQITSAQASSRLGNGRQRSLLHCAGLLSTGTIQSALHTSVNTHRLRDDPTKPDRSATRR